MSQTPEVLQSSVQHGRPMGMILTPGEGLGVDDCLVPTIDEGLAVVALDDAMRGFHLGRLVGREVAADLLARGAIPGLIPLEPFSQALNLLLQMLHLALSVSSASRTGGGIVLVMLLHVFYQQFLHLGFNPFLFSLQL
jgi:hypothetical protein